MKNRTQTRNDVAKLLGRGLVSLIFLATLLVGSAFAQTKQPAQAEKPQAKQKERPPITKQELLTVLQSGGIAPERLLSLVKERGVDFQSSITDEAELGKAGASAELVEAVSSNYRPRKKSFAEKWNKVFGTPNGAGQTGATTGDATQGAALNTPTAPGDAPNAGATNPPAQSLGETIKQIRDDIKQLKKKKQAKTDANAPAQPQSSQPTPPADTQPQTTPPGDAQPSNMTTPPSS